MLPFLSSPERLRPVSVRARALSAGVLAPLTPVRNSVAAVAAHPALTPVKKGAARAWREGRRKGSELMRRRTARRERLLMERIRRMEEEDKKRKRRARFIVIPADHPVKVAWDVCTVVLTVVSAARTHQSIRDRTYQQTALLRFIEVWFFVDVLLNFITEHKTSTGEIVRDGRTVWARYLTTWFVIDALSLVPWEQIYVRPIVEKQQRRNIFAKTFFRSRSVVRVSRILRGRHVKLFGRVARQTKQVGVGGQRLLRLIIKYLPKYLLFYRNMRSVLAIRVLRQVHFVRKLWKQLLTTVREEPLKILKTPGRAAGSILHAAAVDMDSLYDEWDTDDVDGYSDGDGDVDGDDGFDDDSNSLIDPDDYGGEDHGAPSDESSAFRLDDHLGGGRGWTGSYAHKLDPDERSELELDGGNGLLGGDHEAAARMARTVLLPQLDHAADDAPPRRQGRSSLGGERVAGADRPPPMRARSVSETLLVR
jgi:hypothetical protein